MGRFFMFAYFFFFFIIEYEHNYQIVDAEAAQHGSYFCTNPIRNSY